MHSATWTPLPIHFVPDLWIKFSLMSLKNITALKWAGLLHVSEWVSEQCFTSPPTQYRLYGRRFLQVKRPNQQYQSTEG